MTEELEALVAAELSQPVAPEIARAAGTAAARLGGVAVLFYGSVIRTGDLDGLIDFYVLTDGPTQRGVRALASRLLWPDISFEEVTADGRVLRAKVATMPVATFHAAAADRHTDTTIWTRFVQPARLAWVRDDRARAQAVAAVADAVRTTSRYAAVQLDGKAPAEAFFAALFRQTYRAELRFEAAGRGASILAAFPDRWRPLLLAGWRAAGWPVEEGDAVWPHVPWRERDRIAARWRARRMLGRTLNAARLVKAAFLLDGATRYAAWKLERHTGYAFAVTPWRERHPLLAAPGVLWGLWRYRRRTAARGAA